MPHSFNGSLQQYIYTSHESVGGHFGCKRQTQLPDRSRNLLYIYAAERNSQSKSKCMYIKLKKWTVIGPFFHKSSKLKFDPRSSNPKVSALELGHLLDKVQMGHSWPKPGLSMENPFLPQSGNSLVNHGSNFTSELPRKNWGQMGQWRPIFPLHQVWTNSCHFIQPHDS